MALNRNTIRLHRRITGAKYEFQNPVTRKWTPVDGETAETFMYNVLDYRRLPVGTPRYERARAARA